MIISMKSMTSERARTFSHVREGVQCNATYLHHPCRRSCVHLPRALLLSAARQQEQPPALRPPPSRVRLWHIRYVPFVWKLRRLIWISDPLYGGTAVKPSVKPRAKRLSKFDSDSVNPFA